MYSAKAIAAISVSDKVSEGSSKNVTSLWLQKGGIGGQS